LKGGKKESDDSPEGGGERVRSLPALTGRWWKKRVGEKHRRRRYRKRKKEETSHPTKREGDGTLPQLIERSTHGKKGEERVYKDHSDGKICLFLIKERGEKSSSFPSVNSYAWKRKKKEKGEGTLKARSICLYKRSPSSARGERKKGKRRKVCERKIEHPTPIRIVEAEGRRRNVLILSPLAFWGRGESAGKGGRPAIASYQGKRVMMEIFFSLIRGKEKGK